MSWTKKLFARKKDIFKSEKHITKLAFTIKGVDYYCYDDVFSLPYERGLKAITFYEEARMKCDLEFLKLHTEAVNNILKNSKGTVKIFEIERLNTQLMERLNFVVDVDLLYKLASVIFFDKNENPTTYEFKYNIEQKIPFWKSNKDVGDFFLQEQIQNLIPFLKSSEPISQDYVEALTKVNRLHLESLLSHISKVESSIPSGSGV